MNITELSVRRPSAIVMGMTLILGLGVVGYVNLGADLFPSVNTPIISVHSSYIGAGAEEIAANPRARSARLRIAEREPLEAAP
jgi:HAE1 family hydrophobic/amphiphilic exporter-1